MKSEVIKLIEGRDDVTITTYILDSSSETIGEAKRPAVLICPGGAYLCCSDREAEPVALAFARMGYQAFVLRYSIYGAHAFAQKPPIPERKECIHPAPILDIARAFVCIHQHAQEWRVDTDRIAICGFSAGGHNCAMYSTHWSKPIITENLKVDKSLLKPAACILGYPLTDYLYMKDYVSGDEGAEELFDKGNTALLGSNWKNDDKLLELSPARKVDKDVPPTFIWATSEDNLVPVAHSTLYATALANQGIPFEIHIFEEGDHGLALSDQSTAGRKSEINRDAAQWINLCSEWLLKRFSLDI